MGLYSIDCPHCFVPKAPMQICDSRYADKQEFLILFLQCPFCTSPVSLMGYARTKVSDWSDFYDSENAFTDEDVLPVHIYPSKRVMDDIPTGLPEPIERIYSQAIQNYRAGNADAAGVMFRKTLEISLSQLAPDENSRNLANTIQALAKKGILPQDVADWSNEIRGFGNISAHQLMEPDKAELDEIKNFIDMYLRYSYTMRKLLEDRRGRKATDR